MPLHLNSITNDATKNQLVGWIFSNVISETHSMYATEDKKYMYSRYNIINDYTGETIGYIIYTMANREKELEILDVDIVWKNNTATTLQFNEIREGSSEANEYYEAEVADGGGHLEIETVNRHMISGDLVNTRREVFVSAFPFQLNVFEDMDSFNEKMGFKNPIKVGNTDIKVGGFSKKFIMPGGLCDLQRKKTESYSFLVGKVESYRDMKVIFGDVVLPFVFAKVDTALGVIPVAMGKEVFDLEDLKVGCIVAMKADIKADMLSWETNLVVG